MELGSLRKFWTSYKPAPALAADGHSVSGPYRSETAFPAMLEAIASAKRSVLLEVYSFSNDAAGGKFKEALAAKAAEGIPVYLLYDAMGSLTTPRGFFKLMENAGVSVAEYHTLAPWRAYWNWFNRLHRKNLIIDNGFCFTGSWNISHEYAPLSWGGLGWRDTTVKISGPCVQDILNLFWSTWQKCGKPLPPDRGLLKLQSQGPQGKAKAGIASSSGLVSRNAIRKNYRHALTDAQESIYITNAYFLPSRAIRNLLIKAAKRGVSVAIMTPSQTDYPYVRWASWTLFKKLISAGIKIYEWQPSVLHAKTFVIDGMWSSVGSHNLDHRSFRYNLEMNVNIVDSAFGARMKQMFKEDIKQCRKITAEEIRNQTIPFRIASRLLYWIRGLL